MQLPANSFFSSPTLPTEPCYQLLTAVGASSSDNTLASVNRTLQSRIRQHGRQAFELSGDQHFDHLDARIREIFDNLGWLMSASPRHHHYDVIGVHGALVGAVRRRLDALRQLLVGPVSSGELHLRQLVQTDTIALLGSERQLITDKEAPALLLDPDKSSYPFQSGYDPSYWTADRLQNEHDMMMLTREQQLPELPDGMTVVTTRTTEVNTGATLQHLCDLLAPNPANRNLRILLISSNPFVEYQDLVARRVLLAEGSPFSDVETIGPMGPIPTATLLLDTWAKCVYELACIAGVA